MSYLISCQIVAIKCYLCNGLFKTIKEFMAHVEMQHKFFKCTCCCYSGKDLMSLQQHSRDKHYKFTKLLHCPYCHFVGEDWFTIMRHVQSLHLSLSAVYTCAKCGYITPDVISMKVHFEVQHNRPLCLCYCTSSEELLARVTSVINNGQQVPIFDYNCSFCNYQSNYSKSLGQHFKAAHFIIDNGGSLSCMICDEEIIDGSIKGMLDHLNSHDTLINCTLCKGLK